VTFSRLRSRATREPPGRWLVLRRAALGALLLLATAAAAAGDERLQSIREADEIKTSDFDRFTQILQQLDAGRESLDAHERIYLRYLDAWRAVYERRYEPAIPELRAIADEAEDPVLRFRGLVTLTNTLALVGYHEEAYRRLNEVLDLQPQIADRHVRVLGYAVAALLNNQAGQYDTAVAFADRWLAEESDSAGICKALSLKVEAIYRSGKTPPGADAANGIDACNRSKELMFANRTRSFVAGFDLAHGRYDDAIALLQANYAEAESARYALLMTEFDSILAGAYLRNGDRVRARHYAQKAIDESTRNDVIKPVVDAYQVLYEVAKAEGDVRGALAFHEKYAAADKGYLNDTTARSLAYQMVNQQVRDEKRQIDVLNEKNQVLRLQGEVASRAAESNRLYVILLILGLASIGFWAYRTKLAQVRFQKLSRRDGLTGIINRQHFMDEAKVLLRAGAKSGRDICLILIDLDDFKVVNDTHGHIAGDGVLRETVATCQQYMRPGDLFGRLGGEEFGVMLPECSLDVACQRAEELRVALAATLAAGLDHPVSASFGVASFPTDATSKVELVRMADQAMYRVKNRTRNGVEGT